MNYKVPDELEFFERGFGLSNENDPDEGLFSYILSDENGRQLVFTHSPCYGNSLSIKLIDEGDVVIDFYQEGFSSIEFQTWNESKIIRVYFEVKIEKELRVTYFPKPKLHFSEF